MPDLVMPPQLSNPTTVDENAPFQLNSTTKVFYGVGSYWYSAELSAGVHVCTGNEFGGDPPAGVWRSCIYDANSQTTNSTTPSTSTNCTASTCTTATTGSSLDAYAITQAQAEGLSSAIIGVFAIAWGYQAISRLLK